MDYYNDELTVYGLIRDLFIAGSVTCFLYAAHRIAKGVSLQARVTAHNELTDAYTPEEREVLIHRIKRESLQY